MLCVDSMMARPNPYLNMVNIDIGDWVKSLLTIQSDRTPALHLEDNTPHNSKTDNIAQRNGRTCCPEAKENLEKESSPVHKAQYNNIDFHSSFPSDLALYTTYNQRDLGVLSRNNQILELSGFYYPGLDAKGASKKLQRTREGHFLIRSSSNSRFLFAISVKTSRGPTSVRLVYSDGTFRLDCESSFEEKMPRFGTVLELIQYYVKRTGAFKSREKAQCFWLDPRPGRSNVPAKLCKPVRIGVPSLQHLTRCALHKFREDSTSIVPTASLSSDIQNFLSEYPYWL